MATIRHTERGEIVWQGESPGGALAAIEQLGEKASEYELHGLDSTELADAKPTKATLISEMPKLDWRIANELTGEIEQSGFAKKADAEKAIAALRNLDAPGDTAPEFSEPIPKVEGRPVRFVVESA
jgi:hypothetical protein